MAFILLNTTSYVEYQWYSLFSGIPIIHASMKNCIQNYVPYQTRFHRWSVYESNSWIITCEDHPWCDRTQCTMVIHTPWWLYLQWQGHFHWRCSHQGVYVNSVHCGRNKYYSQAIFSEYFHGSMRDIRIRFKADCNIL